MSRKQKAFNIAATFAVALTIGFVMQNGDASAARTDNASSAEPKYDRSSARSVNVAGATSAFGVHSIVTTPLPHLESIQTVAAVNGTYLEVDPPEMGSIFGMPFGECKMSMIARPREGALVNLALKAPCNPEAFFVVKHEGMRFSAITDDAGNASVNVPALTEDASFTVSFDNVDGAFADAYVPDLSSYDRAVLQWQGQKALQLHALEFGATFGDYGHIWSASENNMELTRQGERGFMVRLGEPNAEIPYFAEVYTFPTGLTNRDGEISLQIGAAVTAANCARDIRAQSIQTNSGKLLLARDLRVELPDCYAIGDSLLLKNMFEDVTLASN